LRTPGVEFEDLSDQCGKSFVYLGSGFVRVRSYGFFGAGCWVWGELIFGVEGLNNVVRDCEFMKGVGEVGYGFCG